MKISKGRIFSEIQCRQERSHFSWCCILIFFIIYRSQISVLMMLSMLYIQCRWKCMLTWTPCTSSQPFTLLRPSILFCRPKQRNKNIHFSVILPTQKKKNLEQTTFIVLTILSNTLWYCNLLHGVVAVNDNKNTFCDVPGVVEVPDWRSLLPDVLPDKWVAICDNGSYFESFRLQKVNDSLKARALHSLAVANIVTLK